jgi:hypothetical protein
LRSAGSTWRYIDKSGNSTAMHAYTDPRTAINLSVLQTDVPTDQQCRFLARIANSRQRSSRVIVIAP